MARKYGVAFDKSVKKKLEQEKLSHLANHSSHVAERGLSFLFLVKLSGFQKCKGKNNRQEEKGKENNVNVLATTLQLSPTPPVISQQYHNQMG